MSPLTDAAAACVQEEPNQSTASLFAEAAASLLCSTHLLYSMFSLSLLLVSLHFSPPCHPCFSFFDLSIFSFLVSSFLRFLVPFCRIGPPLTREFFFLPCTRAASLLRSLLFPARSPPCIFSSLLFRSPIVGRSSWLLSIAWREWKYSR